MRSKVYQLEKQMLTSFLSRKRIGLLLRVFSPKSDLKDQTVEQILDVLARAHQVRLEGQLLFSRIDVLVSADDRYGDTDCGGTAKAVRDHLEEEIREEYRWQQEHDSIATSEKIKIVIREVKNGDIFCGMLNYGVAKQMRDRIDYTMILSIGAREYLTAKNMEAMLLALAAGAKVTGLAITELAPSIMEGRIANTCAIWDNIDLMTVGGFDLRAAKALKDDRLVDYVRGWSEEKGEVFYAASGVEEIIPLVRMIKLFGACIAPIMPLTGARWEVSKDPDVQKREQSKLGTKYERQMRWVVAENVDFSFIRGGVVKVSPSLSK